MSDLIPFDYGDHQIRAFWMDGEPWFVAADVCRVLDITNVGNALARLDEADIRSMDVWSATNNRSYPVKLVSEPGLYALIFQSRKPEAKEFKRWITHDVIPSIRKTGGYGLQPQIPQDYASALRELADSWEQQQRQARELADATEHVAQLEPAAHSWESLVDTPGDYSMRDAAQVLDRDPAIQMGQNRLAKYLRGNGWTDRKGKPYQRQVDAGRLVARVLPYEHPHTGEPKLSTQVRVTLKGLQKLHQQLGGERPLRLDLGGEAA